MKQKTIQRKSQPDKSIASACGADAAYQAGDETGELEGCQVAQVQLNEAPKSKWNATYVDQIHDKSQVDSKAKCSRPSTTH